MSDEIGSVHKDPGGKLNIALVYPNTYWVGMSNLGMHTMYRVFNEHPHIVCERFFSDHMRSIETDRPLHEFQIIAFSISYEPDWIFMVKILMDNKIPVKTLERKGRPIIMAGGSAMTLNPEPVADALDVCFLGEGDLFAHEIYEAYSSSDTYEDFIESIQRVRGVYVPAGTYPVMEDEQIREFAGPRPVISTIDPIEIPGHTCIVTDKTAFHDMFMVETARGCPYSCKFCTAREIYSPFRPVGVDKLTKIFDKAAQPGLKIGLVSTSLNNHPQLSVIFEEIMKRNMKVAPPSLRLGTIPGDLLAILKESKTNGVTIAPETGSDELRKSIGKHIVNETILEDVHALITSGIRDIKLYFMVGLPGEELKDIDAIIDLIKHIRQIFIHVSRGNRRIGNLSVSINAFVPKPHTLFERQAMIAVGEAKERIRRIGKAFKSQSNITVNFEGPKWAYIQALLARGDRHVLDLIIQMAQGDMNRWHEILKNWHRNPDYYAMRQRPADEILPWSFYCKSV